MSDPRITCELLARDTLAVKATLDESRDRQWQEVLNDVGSGKVTLQNDDADLALIEYGDYIRFLLDGVARFAIIVESMTRTDIAPGEESDEATVISGRGAVAVFENVVIYPDAIFLDTVPFADARVFNFASLLPNGPDPWATPYDWGDRPTAGPYTGNPADFPPVFSHWVGPEAPDGFGDNQRGDWYFFALIIGAPAAHYRLFFGYDDRIEIWIDNVPLFSNNDTTIEAVKSVDVFLDAFIHTLACRVTNLDPNAGPPDGPTGITMALCTVNPDDSFDTEYWATDPTDLNQFVMPFPARAPGYTPGSLITALYLEATPPGSRDVPSVALVTLTFDEDFDSNGDAWTEYISPSVNIGTDLLTFIKSLAESSYDFWFDPATWELNLYQSRGSASGVTYTETTNITELSHVGKF